MKYKYKSTSAPGRLLVALIFSFTVAGSAVAADKASNTPAPNKAEQKPVENKTPGSPEKKPAAKSPNKNKANSSSDKPTAEKNNVQHKVKKVLKKKKKTRTKKRGSHKKRKATKKRHRKKKHRRAKRRSSRKKMVRRSYIGSKQLNSFINYAVRKHKFKRQELLKLFANIKSRPDIIKLMNRQAEDLPWYRYRKIFLGKKRVNDGVKFWKKHARILSAAEKKYGVPPEIVIAIVGVETLYGQRKGNIAILESLATLSFDFPRRSRFFRSELMNFLRLARKEKFDPLKLRGSFAGAMGMPQFMPSSYRAYAIDFNKDGKRDLFHSPADVIGSVAHYFSTFGWKKGQPVTTRVRIRGKKYRRMPKPSNRLKPHLSLKQYAKYGIKPYPASKRYKSNYKASFIRLRTGKRKREYWLGFNNFYTITRYNHSTLYAMAVHLLSQKIKQKYLASKRVKIKRVASGN